ncbi:MAG: ATP-binding cassette domain-containing protein [Deltaproteobacteria bacterium]|nr:ATP-binding cassette domain-containing protein [Deltaproteobacteria bacterium]
MTDTSHPDPLLALQSVSVCFGTARVVNQVSLQVGVRQIGALVGPNGAGKTTILKTVAGLLKPSEGRISFAGTPIESLQVWEIVERGVVYVPEGMRVFQEMSVLENLEIGAYLDRRAIPERLEMIFHLLPELREKKDVRAGILSGGQQRMVTLARGLMSGARLLLLDDPFQELSPRVFKRFSDTFRSLKEVGITLVIAGQHVRRILHMADVAYLIEDGRVSISGEGRDLLHNPRLQHTLFGTVGDPPSVFHLPKTLF